MTGMTILIAMPNRDQQALKDELLAMDSSLDIRLWPDIGRADDIEFAVLWQHPEGLLGQLHQLRVAQSYGAGVESILKDRELRHNILITRVCGEALQDSMSTYLAERIAAHRLPGHSIAETTVGVLGVGRLGLAAVRHLQALGYQVTGWRRSKDELEDIRVLHGGEQLFQLCAQSDFIICLLPLTPATENILNIHLFNHFRRDAWLINVGRGAHVVENDLIFALEKSLLRGATLDVTRTEPCPPDHPFRRHPAIELTEHTASITDPHEAATVILINYHNLQHSAPLQCRVNHKLGY